MTRIFTCLWLVQHSFARKCLLKFSINCYDVPSVRTRMLGTAADDMVRLLFQPIDGVINMSSTWGTDKGKIGALIRWIR